MSQLPPSNAPRSGARKSRLDALRRRAEEQMDDVARLHTEGEVGTDLRRLMHELRVYQVELELQNEELIRAHEELEVSRARYVDLYEEAPVGYVTFNAQGFVIDANRLAASMLDVSQDRLRGRRFADFVDGQSRAMFGERLAKVLSLSPVQPFEVLLLRANGTQLPAQLQMSLKFTEGSDVRCRVAMADMSHQAELSKRIGRLAAIVDSSDDAIIGADLDGRIISWSRGAATLLGFSAEEVISVGLDVLLPAHDEAEPAWMRQLRRGQGAGRFEGELRARDGVRLPVALTLSPITDERGRTLGISIIARDISDRLEAERLQRLRLRQLDLLAQSGHELIMSGEETDGTFGRVFERVRSAVGADLLFYYRPGRESGVLELAHSHGLTPEQLALATTLAPGASLCGLTAQSRSRIVIDDLQRSDLPEANALREAGARGYAGFPLVAGDRLLGTVALARKSGAAFSEGDLHIMQTVCDQASATLHRMDLIRDLLASELMLRDSDRRKDEFIATLAHELRNPLAAIYNAVNILRQLEGKTGIEKAGIEKAVLETMDRQVNYTVRLVDDLLEVSRVTRGKIELRMERLELAIVLRNAIEISKPLMDARRHAVEMDVPDEPVMVDGDAVRLEQVFANLLNNAGKYTDPGGRIRLGVRVEAGQALVSVRDNGMGITPELLPHVFEMFTQGGRSGYSQAGLGIGLTLARTLVTMHGGTVEARSDGPGTGSEFVVQLPLARGGAGPMDARPGLHRLGPNCRILIADDNRDAADSLGHLLQMNGAEVRVVYGGAAALEALEDFAATVAILDLGMPDVDGYALAQRIRGHPGWRAMTLVALTGWGQEEDRQRTRRAGFDFHLVKPADLDALHRILLALSA